MSRPPDVMRAAGLPAAAVLAALGAGCAAEESAYARSVRTFEPVYCYQSLAAVTCHARPDFRQASRLVNYYGPAPSRYDPPEPPAAAEPAAPPPGGPAVRDPEPRVRPASSGSSGAAAAGPGSAGPDPGPEGEAAGAGSWRYYLPFFTVLFGLAQVLAAFLL